MANQYEQSKEAGFAWRNLEYGASALEGGRNLLLLESLVVSIGMGFWAHSWVAGVLALVFIPAIVSQVKALRVVWSVLFSVIFSYIFGSIAFIAGASLDKSDTAGWVLAFVVGILSFVLLMAKHGWGFLATKQDADRARDE